MQETFVKNVSWTYKLPRRTRLRLDITSISSPQTGLNLFVLYFDQPHYVNDRSVKLIGTGIWPNSNVYTDKYYKLAIR